MITKEDLMSKPEGAHEQEGVFTHRKVAQIVLEAVTPLKVASGKSDNSIDAPVLRDWNNLPMVQGTSMAGVLRASLSTIADQENLFGKDFGSRVLVSHLHLLDRDGKIVYKLGKDPDPDFLDRYDDLPVREHTAINDKGAAKDGSKFDEEVVYAGSRFKFELEFITDNSEGDMKKWESLLSQLTSPLFRLGGGSTKGFGEMEVVSCQVKAYEIGKDYHDKPSDLNKQVDHTTDTIYKNTTQITTYTINLKPDDFFSFGSGFGDEDIDDIAVTEEIVKWDKNNKGSFSNKQILFPASSLKGVLSHRVAYHYNRLTKTFADEVKDIEKHIGENNKAVATLFGKKAKINNGTQEGEKGKALFSDMFKEFDENQVKIFDHVKIDRFTGGAMDSALYNEKVIAQEDVWSINIVLAEDVTGKVKEAFEATLDDLARGWLPLGGKVNRGHGVFVSPEYVEGQDKGWKCMTGGAECPKAN
jgi:CRISPR/Cas system CMR subunit Cmr4 (Cas7 group RAMP superfamily)